MSFSVRYETLGLVRNTLTTYYGYSPNNTDKLPLPVQMQLHKKLETFSVFFVAFLELSFNFQLFRKKDEPPGKSIPEVIYSKRRVYLHT